MVQIIPPGSNAICMIIIVCTLSVGKVKDNIWALREYFAVSLSRLASTITIITTTLIISKKPGNTGISRDIRTEFTTDLLLSD